jgi:CubicO group peptidase (beta-lactamase class C family)
MIPVRMAITAFTSFVVTLIGMHYSSAIAADTVSGWPISNARYDQSKIAALDHAIDAGDYKNINGVVVIKNGQLLIERYYNGTERDDTHNPRSVSKTFTGAILGVAIDEGYIDGLDQPLSDFYDLQKFENYSEKKASVTLRQLITMTSGFDGYDFESDSPGNEENMYPKPDWVRWTLNLPMADDRDPGDEWRYFTAGIVVLGDILNTAVPGGLETYAHKVLFGKTGTTNYEWQHTPQHVANTAGGTQLTALDFAKFGEVHRTRGKWQGDQVLPADWTNEALQPVVDTTVPENRYSYLWWHKSYEIDGALWSTAYCTGNGGNKIFVFDDQELVVVVTASAYGQRYMHSQVDEMMLQYILPSVQQTK